MLSSRGRNEHGVFASPTRTPGVKKHAPIENASPFKRDLGKAPSTSRTGRSAFSDKTNQSPASRKNGVSPSKQRSPEKGKPWPSTVQKPAFSRSNSFVTPAANIGRAGQIKAQMGAWNDAPADEVAGTPTPAAAACSEEELYPEIEHMPERHEPPYVFPAELDGLPRAAEIGRMLARAPWPPTTAEPARPTVDEVEIPPLPTYKPARKGMPSKAPAPTKPRARPKPNGHDALASQAEAFLRRPECNEGFVL